MYKGKDRDELTNSVTDLKEAIKKLERVKELISGTCIDCKEITLDVPARIKDGRTLVPVRGIFEALGATVEWDGATKTVTATRGQDVIKLTIGDTKLYKNGEVAYELDVPAQIMGEGFTMVPVRAISEALKREVAYNAKTRTVIIH